MISVATDAAVAIVSCDQKQISVHIKNDRLVENGAQRKMIMLAAVACIKKIQVYGMANNRRYVELISKLFSYTKIHFLQ